MARTASVAVAGYYPTPRHFIPAIASLISVDGTDYSLFDPCAGDGEAIVDLTKALWPDEKKRKNLCGVYANELEKTRFDALKARQGKDGFQWRSPEVTHGDAFALQWKDARVSILFANPPYDLEKEHGRLEEKFLHRFVGMIHDGGVLLFLVPFYALAKSAGTIAKHFSKVHCVRFPDDDFDIFKQVVLVGKKHPALLEPDHRIRARVLAWSVDASTIPSSWDRPLVTVDPCDGAGICNLKSMPLDIAGLLQKMCPWHSTDRGGRLQPIQGIVPDKPAHDGLGRVYPVVLPMKPAYLASGIAAGVFNGERIMPDDPASGLPEILVKGVFKKDFVPVPEEDKVNKEGDKVQETQVQQPELVITVLDLRSKKYSELLSSVDTTGATEIPSMTVGDLLQHYGKSMMASLRKACPVLHDPAKDEVVTVPGISRPLYIAQGHAVTATLKLLGGVDVPLQKRRGKTAYILGEVGVGKTGVALATMVAMGVRRGLVMCPPHLVPEWQEQVKIWFPETRAVVLEDVRDVHALAEDTDERTTFAIMSRETAKLSHAWEGVGQEDPLPMGKRDWCGGVGRIVRVSPGKTIRFEHKRSEANYHASVEVSEDGIRNWRVIHVWDEASDNGAECKLDTEYELVNGGDIERDVDGTVRVVGGERVKVRPNYARVRWMSTDPAEFGVLLDKKETGRCPSCHDQTHAEPEVLASKRALCQVRHHEPANDVARLVRRMAEALAPVFPKSPHVVQAIHSRPLRRMIAKWSATPLEGAWERARDGQRLRSIAQDLFNMIAASDSRELVLQLGEALLLLLVAFGEETPFASGAKAMYAASADDSSDYSAGGSKRRFALKLLACCSKENREQIAAELRSSVKLDNYTYSFNPWKPFDVAMQRFDANEAVDDREYLMSENGWGEHEYGESSGALKALETLHKHAAWSLSEPCGEFLYQAIPSPKRVALAPYIAKKFPKLFDAIAFDEAHELSLSGDSAQSKAMARLAQLRLPSMALTGTRDNGYARSLFALQWALDPDFRREFDRNQEGLFVQRYGYLKKKVEYRDKESGKAVTFGTMSDRVERTEREAGCAPGVLPLFVLQYLLKRAVVIHKEDLNIDLPPCVHIVERVMPDDELLSRYNTILEALRRRIKADAFGPLAGKLFGQMNRVMAMPDMITDDMCDGSFDIRYPEDCGGGLVASVPSFPSSVILPKEQWILDTIERELSEDRNVLVFGYHAEVLPRLRRLIQTQLGTACALLLASENERAEKTGKKLARGEGPVAKLAPKKRKPWIQSEIVGRGIRVMVVNSQAVQTGMNDLVHFNTGIWDENPAVNPIGFDQANGRLFRPGQKKDTRFYFPLYAKTVQTSAHSLLMQKVAVMQATCGLDARGALAAAGVGSQETLSAFSVGKQLFRIMETEEERAPVHVPQVVAATQGKTEAPFIRALPSLRTQQVGSGIDQLKLF